MQYYTVYLLGISTRKPVKIEVIIISLREIATSEHSFGNIINNPPEKLTARRKHPTIKTVNLLYNISRSYRGSYMC